MSRLSYVAHKTDDGHFQSIQEHLNGTANACESFAHVFGEGDVGRVCGMMHDIGKYSPGFQHRILEDGPKVDHASAGAIECWRRRQPYAAMCIMGHHGGLMNLGMSDDVADSNTFYGRMRRYQSCKKYDYDAWKDDINLPEKMSPLPKMDHCMATFYTRMLYSCLVDADFLDTAAFMGETRESVKADWDELNHRLDDYVCGWYPPKSNLNRIRCSILDICKTKGEGGEGDLFTLTVPTGGGKTVASLAFALRHARRTGKARIIYVIPYTSIIEQTAEVFRKIFGDDMVLEHHSGVVYEDEEGETLSERQRRMKHATENWDMPIIVTTAVQFFESLFSNKPSHCRKLHNIANSVVIFDEAQMLPIASLRPCVYAISELTRTYKMTAVLCTATQPALDHLFEEYLNKRPQEICSDELCRAEIFKRVTFRKGGKMTEDEIAEKMNLQNQVLCIVNSRESAQRLYGRLEKEGRFHLSTLMPPVERQKQLAMIRERIERGEICRVVSTSLIEAGVDVDFPTVYREMVGLDSILQAAGRCNRNGKRARNASEVFVFDMENVPVMLKTAIDACESAWNGVSDPLDTQVITKYFKELLDFKGDAAQDAQFIMDMMKKSTLPFEDIAESFRMIDSNAVTVYIPTDESRLLIEQYRNGLIDRTLMRKLGRFGVTVYPNKLQELQRAGDVEDLGGNVYALLNENLYDERTGLSLTVEQGKAMFC